MRLEFFLSLAAAAVAVLGAPNPERLEERDDASSSSSDSPSDPAFTQPIPTSVSATTSGPSEPTFSYAFNIPTLAPELNSLLSEEQTILTLPPSILSVLKTAAPTTVNVADGCVLGGSKLPDWFGKLPKDVQSYLTSYESGVQSWYTAHSSQLGALSSYVAELSSYDASYLGKSTDVMPVASACSVLAVQSTGITYPDATKTGKKNVAAKPTGALAAGVAGVVGVLGVVAAL